VRTSFKNIFIAFCFTIYCLSVFGSFAVPSFESKFSDQNQNEGVHFTELSKILFPQAINSDGSGSIVHVSVAIDNGINRAFAATQFLSKLTVQYTVNYFKETRSLLLKFRTEDIIFPFHNFW